jgi:hypothetical protein
MSSDDASTSTDSRSATPTTPTRATGTADASTPLGSLTDSPTRHHETTNDNDDNENDDNDSNNDNDDDDSIHNGVPITEATNERTPDRDSTVANPFPPTGAFAIPFLYDNSTHSRKPRASKVRRTHASMAGSNQNDITRESGAEQDLGINNMAPHPIPAVLHRAPFPSTGAFTLADGPSPFPPTGAFTLPVGDDVTNSSVVALQPRARIPRAIRAPAASAAAATTTNTTPPPRTVLPGARATTTAPNRRNAAATIDINQMDSSLELLEGLHQRRMAQFESVVPRGNLEALQLQWVTETPLLDKFYLKGGSACIQAMTNFTVDQLRQLWRLMSHDITQHWNIGRGRRTHHRPLDVLFMTLTVFKYGDRWDVMAKVFELKSATFEKLITTFIDAVSPLMYDKLVVQALKEYSMENLYNTNRQFKHFPGALYATDVRFQETNRLTAIDGNDYFSGKHSLHGFKQEISVLPNGLAVTVSDHVDGSKSDYGIFASRIDHHRILLTKSAAELEIPDHGPAECTAWAVLCDVGFEGGREHLRVIHPIRSVVENQQLNVIEERHNQRVVQDRAIVDSYFGRLCKLWGMCSNKYRWSEGNYDTIMKFCVAVTNFHVGLNPLNEDDLLFYAQYSTRLLQMGEERVRARTLKQVRYREKRRRRLEEEDVTTMFDGPLRL